MYAFTEYAARLFAIQELRRDERKLKHAISKKARVVCKTESPIVRHRIKQEIVKMNVDLDLVQRQFHDMYANDKRRVE
jgi:TATA-binding protein-associated factor Taf7